MRGINIFSKYRSRFRYKICSGFFYLAETDVFSPLEFDKIFFSVYDAQCSVLVEFSDITSSKTIRFDEQRT